MKSAAEEKKARSSMSSTFGSVMNPDMRDFKLSLDQALKQRKGGAGNFGDDSDGEEVVSILPPPCRILSNFHGRCV